MRQFSLSNDDEFNVNLYDIYIYRKTSYRSPRLLSVQVNQTPGLYAGPGVYLGAGVYHNMSSLCCFIQKMVNFHVYQVPVFCLFSH